MLQNRAEFEKASVGIYKKHSDKFGELVEKIKVAK